MSSTKTQKILISALVAIALSTTALTPVTAFAKATAPAAAKPAAPAKAKPKAHKVSTAPATSIDPALAQSAKPAYGPVDFAQNHSDIAADPAARFGVLPNGLHYVILKNATPPGTAALRLRIGGGSMMESEQQRGLAHFIEHMAFNGSKNVAEGDMVKILERHGLKFGPDTNAETNFDETVYQLNLPTVSEDDVDTGLFLLRETAGNLLLDDGAIDRERGVILGEERARDQPGTHDYKKWSTAAFGDEKYASRLPIGLVPIIQSAKHDSFEDLYSNIYRPDLATLVVVGDIDPDAIEAKIKAKFSDWTAAIPALRPVDFGAYANKGLRADSYAESGLPDGLSISWAKPIDEHYQTHEKNVEEVLDSVRLAILNQRLERQSKLPAAAFAAAGAGHFNVEHTAEMTQINITPKPGRDKEAFTQVYASVRQYQAFGADQPELDRIISDMETGAKAALQGAKTRQTPELSDEIVGAVESSEVFTSPQQDYDFFESIKPLLTLANINAGIKPLFNSDGPLIWHSGEDADIKAFDKPAMLAAYTTVQSTRMAVAASHANKAWPYTDFGKPSAVVKRDEIKDLGVTQLTYANGVHAIIKTTDFEQDKIGITVRFAGGLLALSPSQTPPVFEASSEGVYEGGLGKLDSSDIKDSLTGKIASVGFGIGDDSMALAGGTTKEDFATQMQELMAFTTDAAYRADALARLKNYLPNFYTSLESSPGGVFQMKADSVLHGNDPRFGIPSQDAFKAVTNDQIKALISTQLKTAPVEITIVGDIGEADAEAEIGKTFAALGKRAAMPVIPHDFDTVKFPAQNLHQIFDHHGRADQDLSFVAWPGVDFFSDTQRARTLTLLAEVLTLRLTDEVREKQGLSYSPNAGSYTSDAFTGYGYISATAEVKPDQDQNFYTTLAGIVADLKARPISADELLRAQKPLLDGIDNDLKTNAYWMGVLPGSTTEPARLDAIRSRKAQYMKVTADDLQKAANAYLDMDKALRIQVKPADSVIAAAATSATSAANSSPPSN